jgi:hypothetical protein
MRPGTVRRSPGRRGGKTQEQLSPTKWMRRSTTPHVMNLVRQREPSLRLLPWTVCRSVICGCSSRREDMGPAAWTGNANVSVAAIKVPETTCFNIRNSLCWHWSTLRAYVVPQRIKHNAQVAHDTPQRKASLPNDPARLADFITAKPTSAPRAAARRADTTQGEGGDGAGVKCTDFAPRSHGRALCLHQLDRAGSSLMLARGDLWPSG